MKVYIAGPMTGIPQFNIPAFDEAAAVLRAQEHEVVSPAELDDLFTREEALSSGTGDQDHVTSGTWGDFLARDVKMIADDGIEAVFVLPGWEQSKGARMESFVAHLCGLPVLRYPDGLPVPRYELIMAWTGELPIYG